MTMYERIEELRRKSGLSQGKLEKELGFSNGSISKWRTSTPSPDRLQKLSDYFHVTVEYLMTGKEKEFPEFEPEHIELIMLYSKLNEEQKRTVLTFLRSLAPRD